LPLNLGRWNYSNTGGLSYIGIPRHGQRVSGNHDSGQDDPRHCRRISSKRMANGQRQNMLDTRPSCYLPGVQRRAVYDLSPRRCPSALPSDRQEPVRDVPSQNGSRRFTCCYLLLREILSSCALWQTGGVFALSVQAIAALLLRPQHALTSSKTSISRLMQGAGSSQWLDAVPSTDRHFGLLRKLKPSCSPICPEHAPLRCRIISSICSLTENNLIGGPLAFCNV